MQDHAAVIAMNHKPVNAIDHPMIDAIHAALRRADADPDVRAVILISALPRMFCGGMDLRGSARGGAVGDDLAERAGFRRSHLTVAGGGLQRQPQEHQFGEPVPLAKASFSLVARRSA